MKRLPDWEKKLQAVIKRHMGLPSQYGVSDCYLIADDAVEAITGERMFPDVIGYQNEIGAAKALKKHGFKTVEDAFASKFETVPIAMAQRGDIGVIDNNGEICGGVFTAIGFMVRDKTTPLFVPISYVKTAFKVAR